MRHRFLRRPLACLVFLLAGSGPLAVPGLAAENSAGTAPYTLPRAIDEAISANLDLMISQAGTEAARAAKRVERSKFLPTFGARYQYKHRDEQSAIPLFGVTAPQDEHIVVGSVTQPVFKGFALTNRYRIARLGLDMARIRARVVRQDIIFDTKDAFFTILRTLKLTRVAEQAVRQLSAHQDVARNFHEVGMTPYNDYLKAQVELANARQELIVARNNVEIAKSDFNILLRRPINAPVRLDESMAVVSFERDIAFCLDLAEANRLELDIARLEVEQAEKERDLAGKGYYPDIDMAANYYRRGDDPSLDGGEGIDDAESWDVTATATWEFWEWGRTRYGVDEKESRLRQARLRREKAWDRVALEVKQAFLNTMEAQRNILAVKKAVRQARENFRITDQRYKEQVATTTDVLDAQTLLTRTMSNYYNALYNFEISKAALFRAMGLEVME